MAPPTVRHTPGGSTLVKGAQLMRILPEPDHAGSHALRVALYARVSTEAQVREGYGLSYQEEQLRGFAEANGHRIVEVVAEPGVSRTELPAPASTGCASLPGADK
jgi:Resolvase, N terminal domain